MFKTKIMNKDAFYERRVKNGMTIRSTSYFGKKEDQETNTDIIVKSDGSKLDTVVSSSGGRWVDSKAYHELWTKIEDKIKAVKDQLDRKVNINNFPDDYYDIVNQIRIDITRRRVEEMDFTAEMSIESTNPNYAQSITLKEELGFAGVFEEIKGRNDNVPMIEHKTAAIGTVPVILYGLGDARTLEDELYNLEIYSLQKVNAAVSRAHTGLRNHLLFNTMIALSLAGTWDAAQQVAAINTGTYDENLYLTLRNAIRTLKKLRDMQTGQYVTGTPVLLVGNDVIEWDIGRVMNGQLASFGSSVRNRESLPIGEVWNYQGDVIDVGPRRTTYPGVPDGYAYLFIPGPAGAPFYTFNKRELTREVGRGDVLKLSREQTAWYFGMAQYYQEFLGSSGTLTKPVSANDYGYCVEITLPNEPDAT